MELLQMTAREENLNTVLAAIRRCLKAYGCSDNEDVVPILVAAEEIFVNIVHYAYHNNKNEGVEVKVETSPHLCRMTFTDRGIPYNPLEHTDPDLTLDLASRPIGGLGILMVKEIMDYVFYENRDGMNILVIEKGF